MVRARGSKASIANWAAPSDLSRASSAIERSVYPGTTLAVSSTYTLTQLKKGNLQLLLTLTCLHVIGFCVYFAVATQSQTGDASIYDDIVTTGVLGWSLMPLTALVESLHLDLQTDAAPVAIGFFVGNSVVLGWLRFRRLSFHAKLLRVASCAIERLIRSIGAVELSLLTVFSIFGN